MFVPIFFKISQTIFEIFKLSKILGITRGHYISGMTGMVGNKLKLQCDQHGDLHSLYFAKNTGDCGNLRVCSKLPVESRKITHTLHYYTYTLNHRLVLDNYYKFIPTIQSQTE